MNKTDVKDIVKSEIKKYFDSELDKEVSAVLKKKSKTRDELIITIKDSLEAVYKMLWTKRDFWKSDIK